jgi:hypothetical protein
MFTDINVRACEARRLGGLRALFKYTQIVAGIRQPDDFQYNDPPDHEEAILLEENNIAM